MHVAIEMNELRITHVHQLADVVGGLVYLESAKLKNILFDDTHADSFLDGLTTLELDKLYLNTTGVPFSPVIDDLTRRQAIAEVINTMQQQTVDREELRQQIEHVEAQLEAPVPTAVQFKYVFGAKVPRVLDGGLFPLHKPPLSADQLAQAAQLAPQRRVPRAATQTPATAAPKLQRQARPAAAPVSGNRVAIFAHADKVWEAAGKPMNPAEVLVLRKRMMVELEEQGIKKTTSSTALGDWMKQRLA